MNAEFNGVYKNVVDALASQTIDQNKLPLKNFPKTKEEFICCPVCKQPISENLERFRKQERTETWQPEWRTSKKDEGEDSSIQIMHVKPLIEGSFLHNAENVRYGHRWCNVAMTDHSLDETLDFMEFVLKAHNRRQ